MRVIIERRALSALLAVAGRAVSTRSTLPILSHVLLRADADGLSATGTDLAVMVTASSRSADVRDQGQVAAPARLLTDLVNGMPDNLLTLTAKKGRLTIEAERTHSTVNGLEGDEFPAAPVAEFAGEIALTGSQFARLVQRSAYAASSDNARPALAGVKLEIGGGRLLAAATDGYRLAVALEEVGEDAKAAALVPAKALIDAERALKNAEAVSIGLADNSVRIQSADAGLTMIAQLIDAKFPDYKAIIPAQHSTSVMVDGQELLHALRVARLFAANSRVTLAFGADGVATVAAEAQETGQTSGSLTAEIDGPAIEIAVNGEYLAQAVAPLAGGRVMLRMTRPDRPMLIMAPEGNGYRAVIMPMQLGR